MLTIEGQTTALQVGDTIWFDLKSQTISFYRQSHRLIFSSRDDDRATWTCISIQAAHEHALVIAELFNLTVNHQRRGEDFIIFVLIKRS